MDYKGPINKERVFTMRTGEKGIKAFNTSLLEILFEEKIVQLFPAFTSKHLKHVIVIEEDTLDVINDFITEIET